jgi:hypothetical protein
LNHKYQEELINQFGKPFIRFFSYLPYAKIAAGFQSTSGQPQESILAWKTGLVKGNLADIASIITLW